MKAIARLVLTYFTCTKVMRTCSVTGLALLVAAYLAVRFLPHSELITWLALTGSSAFYIGSTLMPLLFGQSARSHLIQLVPNGRLKLLASAFVTVAVVSLPLSPIWVLGYQLSTAGSNPSPAYAAQVHDTAIQLFWAIYTAGFLISSWLYVALWFITSQRTVAGLLRGMLVLILLLYAPTKPMQSLPEVIQLNVMVSAGLWSVFAIGFIGWPRWKAGAGRLIGHRRLLPALQPQPSVHGRELDFYLGTHNPWTLALAQAAPVIIAARLSTLSPSIWLFYLTTFSTVSGAIAGVAAERSRPLWLRSTWSRAEFFEHVERSFWRHNSIALGVLLVLMLAIGAYCRLPLSLLAVGLPLLALGTALSTYLGLVVTRGLGWLESLLAIIIAVVLMSAAAIATRGDDSLAVVAGLEVFLAGLAFVLRETARRRWLDIDWALCRPDRALRARPAA